MCPGWIREGQILSTPHSSFNTQYSPFELVFGRKPNEIPFLASKTIDPIYNIDNFALETRFKLQNAQKWANDLLQQSNCANKHAYDKNTNPIGIFVNDKVMLVNENRHKHEPLYKGPYIVRKISDQNVKIMAENSKKAKLVHKNNIRKY